MSEFRTQTQANPRQTGVNREIAMAGHFLTDEATINRKTTLHPDINQPSSLHGDHGSNHNRCSHLQREGCGGGGCLIIDRGISQAKQRVQNQRAIMHP